MPAPRRNLQTVTPDAGDTQGAACTVVDPLSLSTTLTCNAAGRYALILSATDGVSPVVASSTTVNIIDDNLAISTLQDITADATSPRGASTTYPLPEVADQADTAVPVATCSPGSESTFSVGTTTVHCSATDTDDSNSAAWTTFTVAVEGPSYQLAALYQEVQGVGPGKSLTTKVTTVEGDLASGRVNAACSVLGAFVHEVMAQSGKHIASSTAEHFVADAEKIGAVMACWLAPQRPAGRPARPCEPVAKQRVRQFDASLSSTQGWRDDQRARLERAQLVLLRAEGNRYLVALRALEAWLEAAQRLLGE